MGLFWIMYFGVGYGGNGFVNEVYMWLDIFSSVDFVRG